MKNRFWLILVIYSSCLFISLGSVSNCEAAEPAKESGSAPTKKELLESSTNLIKSAAELEQKGEWEQCLETNKKAIEQCSSIGERKLEALADRGAATACFHLGRLGEATEFVDKAIEINKTLKNAKGRCRDLILAARIAKTEHDYSKALAQLDEAQKIIPSSEYSELPGMMTDLVEVNVKLRRFPEAIAILNRLGLYYSKNNDLEKAAGVWAQQGELYILKGDYGNASTLLKKAEKSFSDSNKSKELEQTLYRLAYLAFVSGDYKQTQSYLDAAKKQGSHFAEKWPQAIEATMMAIKSFEQGATVQASSYLEKAGQMLEQGQDIPLRSRILLIRSKIETEQCNWKMAENYASTALKEFTECSNPDGEAEAELVLAQIYFRQSSLKEALEHSQRSLDIYRKLKNRDRMVDCRILIAEVNEIMGDPSSSLKQLKDAIEESKAGLDPKTSNYLRIAVARFRVTRENTQKALESALEGKKDFKATGDLRGEAEANLTLGLAYELGGDMSKARQSFEKALEISQKLGDKFSQGKALTALGVIYKNSGDLEKAQEIFVNAMELRKSIGDQRGYAANLANLANIYRRRSQNTEALQNLQKALNIYREASDKRGEADALTNLGNLDAIEGSYQTAMEKFQKALLLHRETSDIRGIATDLISIASLRLARGEIDEGAAALKEAEAYNKKIYNPHGTLAILSESATLAKAKKNYNQALDYLNKSLELAKKTQDAKAVSSINLKMASVYEEMGNFQKALDIIDRSSAQLEKHKDYKGLAWALGTKGILLAKMEDYESALNNLNQAEQIRNEHNIISSQSQEVDFYLAEIYQGFKDYDRALEYYHKALSGSQSPGMDRFVGRIYDRIGTIYYGMDEYSKARDFLEDAMRISSESGDVKNQKAQLIRLADVMSKLREPDNGLKYLQKALTLTRDTKDSSNEARVLTRMGTLNQSQGRLKTALENYSEAMDIRTKIGDKRGVNENVLQIAMVNATMGDFDESVTNIKRAIDIARTSEDRGMLWKAYFIMGRTLEDKKGFGEALEAYRTALNIVDSMDADFSEESEEDDFIFGGTSALFETTLRVLMTLAKKDPDGAYDNQALRLIERLKAASFQNTLTKINVTSFSNVPNDLIIKEKSLKLSLNKLNQKLMEQRSKIHPNTELMKRLLEERRKKETAFANLREQLSKEYPAYVNLTKPKAMSIHQIQRSLDPDEVLLEYMVTRARTYIFAVDKFRFHTFSVDYPLSEIEKDVELLVRPLQKHETLASWDPSVAYKLYSKVIKPVEYTMKGKKTVVVIPNGPLCWVPFEILVDSKSHESRRFWSANDPPSYLLEKYAFCYAESAYSLCLYRNKKPLKKPGWTLAAFGDPLLIDPNKTLERNPGSHRIFSAISANQSAPGENHIFVKPLQATRKEIVEINKELGGPTQIYVGPQATETLFKKADLSRYLYIHLGAYSVFWNGLGKSQQQPGILFSLFGDKENDGFLELGEVFGLQLNADVVVISTTLTSGKNVNLASNGPFDLARGFIFAGADSVVLSTWQISEDHAKKLLLEMYRDLKDGSKAEALRQAKLAMLHSPGTSHPYYWGSFILIGDWRTKFLNANNRWEPESVGIKGVSTWRKLFNM